MSSSLAKDLPVFRCKDPDGHVDPGSGCDSGCGSERADATTGNPTKPPPPPPQNQNPQQQQQKQQQQAQNRPWWGKALSYFYYKGGNGEGFGIKGVKVGPAKVDIAARHNGKDVKQTTEGKTITTINSEVGAKVEFGPIKLGVQRTDEQEEGKPRTVKWVPGYERDKAEGEGAEVGVGLGGCIFVCGQVEVGIQLDKVVNDLRKAVGDEVSKILTEPITSPTN